VTKVAGLNRFVWDVRHKAGVTAPPGQYQARVKVGSTTLTETFNVLIDPRVAEEGITLADLQQQFEHNLRMREMVNSVNQLATRVREAQTKMRKTSTADESTTRLNAVAAKLLTEPVRYGKPGLQAHITYLAGMTANTDQKIGRDAIERYQTLSKELETLKAEVNQILGPAQPVAADNGH
jgi:DNA anti-recombination protein RmuC